MGHRMADTELNFAQVEGHSIAYREAGHSPALVLLHGFLCDSRCWRRQITELSDRFRVVAWDAPGAGSSSDPTEPFTTADYARCLARFLDELGVVRAHVLGLSWGGILAQEFYRMYPQRLRCLVLADTYAGWKGSLPEPVWRERLASCLRDTIAPAGALVAKVLPGIFSDRAPQDIQDEQSTIMSEFHPVGFRLMSISSAETDTQISSRGFRCPRCCCGATWIVAVRCTSPSNCTPPFPAPNLRSSRRLDTSVTWSNRKSSMHRFVASV